ncbi:putative pathogenesis-related [Hyphodiscus hymeniophilus]|uniref:Pathogenesis-related n=1 Tax=Hyphodiscus hymeniophilus TaxID=353542 RepID=A0A9P6VLM1_9HELO|nr:putative pathogenesis-related [Hyphodiscus hymeniophilus]
MRSSTILAVLGATLAIATPLNHERLHKKAIVYDIVTDIVYVTVTEGEGGSPPPTTVHLQSTVYVNPVEASPTSSIVKPVHSHSHSEKPSSTFVPPPPPPTTSSTPPAAPTTTSEAPAPTIVEPITVPTTAAPPVENAPAPVEAPVVEAPATTSAAPVVEAPATTSAAPVVEVAATSPKAVAPTVAAAVTSDNSLASTGVDNHNSCRSKHSGENVSWNETLASYAAITAKTCVFAHDMSEGTGHYGQNIASQGSSSSDAWTLESALENAIISEWYSEESLFTNLYGQESPSGTGDFLHFTQVVWKNSLEIGCAVQACPTANSIFPGMYTWFTVCNYYPQGNVEGEFAENVLSS